ncbi:TetR/AcrR family transcriptional regulator [uncultured Psychrobacter sp.]|uniref:TetR/AcrR family transcriptional regulator n=1 Tax=uncultured Psychrobacter sp. TaxID=259303 RepID=UPI002611FEF0|nr:TetR/AcrR family transcriptional regulator [uncultured Psychrobacter sp.]
MSAQAKFNRDEVIEKAKNLYWEKGYHATSMRNLQDVVDMRPGSIYAAFGNKDNLFKEALNRYAQQGAANLANSIAQEKTVLDGLKRFIRSVTICSKGTAYSKDAAPSGMCMVVKTIGELTQNDSPELLSYATSILERVEASFVKAFEQAIDNGEISSDKDPAELARYFQIQLIGLRTYAQVSHDTAAVDQYIDGIFETLL